MDNGVPLTSQNGDSHDSIINASRAQRRSILTLARMKNDSPTPKSSSHSEHAGKARKKSRKERRGATRNKSSSKDAESRLPPEFLASSAKHTERNQTPRLQALNPKFQLAMLRSRSVWVDVGAHGCVLS